MTSKVENHKLLLYDIIKYTQKIEFSSPIHSLFRPFWNLYGSRFLVLPSVSAIAIGSKGRELLNQSIPLSSQIFDLYLNGFELIYNAQIISDVKRKIPMISPEFLVNIFVHYDKNEASGISESIVKLLTNWDEL